MTIHILAVDDDGDLLDLYALILHRQGYIVDPASTLDVAIRRLQSKQYDLLICDDNVYGEGGVEFVQQLQAGSFGDNLRTLPFLFITAGGYERVAKAFGLVHAMAKPFGTPQTLCDRVERILKKAADVENTKSTIV